MTLPVLNAARRVAFLSAGAEKAKVVKSVLRGPSGPGNGGALPAALIRPHAGSLDWFLDRAAAALLDSAREPCRASARQGGRAPAMLRRLPPSA
jgi:6-phosphogluconolactonase